jgi:nuclear pore complex protein Nup107
MGISPDMPTDSDDSKIPRPSSVPSKVKNAYHSVAVAIEPLMHGILQSAKDGEFPCSFVAFCRMLTRHTEEESSDLLDIRTMYLPEVIIAYNTVLCTAGHMISRDELLSSMDLSTVVARQDSGLTETFVRSRRVKELVKSFAETSKIMLKLNEAGKARKEKKGGHGRTLAIWEING